MSPGLCSSDITRQGRNSETKPACPVSVSKIGKSRCNKGVFTCLAYLKDKDVLMRSTI